MTFETMTFIAAGAVAGGFINGLAGFGIALFALGWWLHVLAPVEAVAMVLVTGVLTGLQGAYLVRRSIEPKRLARFLVPGLIGIPIGMQLLQFIGATELKLLIGVFLITYGAFFILRSELPKLERETPITDGSIGMIGGILGAIAGLSGALPTMWLAMRAWPKDRTRGVLQPYNLVILAVSALLLALTGAYTPKVLKALALAIPFSILGATIGIFVYPRLSDLGFRRLLVAMMLVSGIVLLARELTTNLTGSASALAQPITSSERSSVSP